LLNFVTTLANTGENDRVDQNLGQVVQVVVQVTVAQDTLLKQNQMIQIELDMIN
jgi:hypothetical protein